MTLQSGVLTPELISSFLPRQASHPFPSNPKRRSESLLRRCAWAYEKGVGKICCC